MPAPVASTLGLGSLRKARGDDKTAKGEGDVPPGLYAFLPPQTCPVCYSTTTGPPSGLGSASAATAFADPTLPSASLLYGSSSGPSGGGGGGGAGDTAVKIPYVADCRGRCRYCYYCIVGTLVRAEEDAEESWTCLRCGDEVTGANREEVVIPEEEDDETQEQDDELAEEPKEAAD